MLRVFRATSRMPSDSIYLPTTSTNRNPKASSISRISKKSPSVRINEAYCALLVAIYFVIDGVIYLC